MWVTIVLAIIMYVVWKIKTHEKHCLDHLPGPPTKPIIGNVLDLISLSPSEVFNYTRNQAKIFKKRHVLRIFNRRILYLYNPEDIEVVLNNSKNITKNKPYVFSQPWLGTGLLNSTDTKWHKRRKILTPTFHFDILRNFLQVFEEKSQELVTELLATNGNEVDVNPIATMFALYTLLETAMGTRLNEDKSTAASEYKTAILNIGSLVLKRLNRIWLYNDFVFKRSAIGKQFYRYIASIHAFDDKIIKERKKLREKNKDNCDDTGIKKRVAMLDLLLDFEKKGEMDLEGVREEVHTFMLAGHETTGTILSFALMTIADREDIQERICEEYQLVMGARTIPTIPDFAEMKYLEAVIKETMRVFCNPPTIGRFITEDFMLGDLLVKAGSEVGIQIYDLHHHEDLFPEPEEFRPERFLNGEVTHPYSFIPFSAGPRNCIGQKFAMLELKTVISKVCSNFKMTPRHRNWRCNIISDLFLRPSEPIYISFIPRNKDIINS